MRILGLKILGRHDTGAALIDSEKVIAIHQERLDRKKYSAQFPIEAINYCLKEAGLEDIGQIDIVAVDQMTPDIDPIIKTFSDFGLWEKIKTKVVFVNHHDAHAASAYFCSPFNEAGVMVIDAGGQTSRSADGKLSIETESFYKAENGKLELLRRNKQPVKPILGLEGIGGIGNFYTQVTYFLNFGRNEEGKTMGLAPYGANKFMDSVPAEQFVKKINALQYVFQTPLEPHPEYDFWYLFKKNSYSRKAALIRLIRGLQFPKRHPLFTSLLSPFTEGPRRDKKISLPDSPDNFYTDLAYWAQAWLEKTLIDYAGELYKIIGSGNLCFAGGVALNSVANKKILDATPFKNIFIQPASGDSGIPLGAALWAKHQLSGDVSRWQMKDAYLGRDYPEKEILEALNSSGEKYQKLDNPEKTAAEFISQEKIIGWFQGRSEYGPRALGNRSILCSPIPKDMKDKLNAQVKHRESFRPFAPAILEEKTSEYFDLNCPSPFMLLVAQVKKDNIPAVTHVDNTGRVQTVSQKQNPKFYGLIKEFEKITGIPVVLNTSFNDNGEPIVETSVDAIKTFRKTNLDALVIGDYLIEK